MALIKKDHRTSVQDASEIFSIIDSEYEADLYSFFRDIFIHNHCPPLQKSRPLLELLAEKRATTPAFSFFSDQEIIIHLLSSQPRSWHLDYRASYEKLLVKYSTELTISARSLMQFLANINLGITNSCMEEIKNTPLKPETLLEIQILNVINAIEENNKERIENWKERCIDKIARFEENINHQKQYENAIYCLPILGALNYEAEPKGFIYQCIRFSFDAFNGLPVKDKYLMSHIRVYFRNSILHLCKQGKIEDLLEINRDCSGWTETIFEQILNSAYLEECRTEMERKQRSQQDKDMSRSPKYIEREIDLLVENP